MTIRHTRTVVVGLALAAGALACNNDKLPTINENPNSPVDAPAGAVFTNAARSAVGRFLGAGYDLRGTEFVAQHLAEVQYPDEDRYNRLQGPSTTGYFDGTYISDLQDLNKVILKGQAESAPGIWAPAAILQVWDFGYMTDTWGDVPYSQALAGDSGNLSPAYDKQQDIYTSFFSRLTDAVTQLGSADPVHQLGSADPIYQGDFTKWQKFGNSLRARFAMRIVNVDPATANTQLTAALSDPAGVIETNDDNAELQWPGDGVYDNPWANNFKTRDDHRLSNTLMNIMLPSDDPRVPQYAQPTQADNTVYAGMPNGLLDTDASKYLKTASRPGIRFYVSGGGGSQPSYLMTAAEVLFIKAEAAERGMAGLTPAQAKGFYDAAITASMEQWGITDDAAISAFLADTAIAYKGGTPGLVQIAKQKWVALFSDGGNAWAEWRRTCQPVTVHAGPAAIVSYVPRRFEYSQTEYSVNGDNLSAALTQMGGPDQFSTRMWWDSNPTAAPTYTTACNVP